MFSKLKALCGIAFVVMLVICLNGQITQAKEKKPIPLSKATIKLSKTKYVYSGKEKKPKVTVTYKNKKLKNKKDYTYSFSDNIKPGKASVKIKAIKKSKKNKKPKYSGSKTKKFTIDKAARTITTDKKSYSSVEGDGSFTITAKLSKGSSKFTFLSTNTNVATIGKKTGKVKVKKNGVTWIKISVAEGKCYKAASVAVKLTIGKYSSRVFDAKSSILNFNYKEQIKNIAPDFDSLDEKNRPVIEGLTSTDYKIHNDFLMPGLASTVYDDYLAGKVLCRNLCPQGICFTDDYMLTTSYCMDKVHESCMFVFDRATGSFLDTVVLNNKSHVGGITFDGENVWICHSDSTSLQRINYLALKKYIKGTKKTVKINETPELQEISNKPSSVAYEPATGLIWVAEFLGRNDYDDAIEEYEQDSSEDERPKMHAYQYINGELLAANIDVYGNPYEQDYLGIVTKTASADNIGEEGIAKVVSGAAVEWVNTGVKIILKDAKGKKSYLHGYEDEEDKETDKEIMSNSDETYDIIVAIDDKAVDDHDSMEKVLSEYKTGDTVELAVLRYDDANDTVDKLSGSVTLGERVKTGSESKVVELPHSVQGLAFSSNGHILLSRSYVRSYAKSRSQYISQIDIYNQKKNGNKLTCPDRIVVLPPMIENVAFLPGSYSDGKERLYLLFESAAYTYLEGKDGAGKSECPIDKMVSINLEVGSKTEETGKEENNTEDSSKQEQ